MKSTILLIHYTFVVKKGCLSLGDGDGFESLELLYASDEEYKNSYLAKTRNLKRNLLDSFTKRCDAEYKFLYSSLDLRGAQLTFTAKTRNLKRNLLDYFTKEYEFLYSSLDLKGVQLAFTGFNCVHSITTDYSG